MSAYSGRRHSSTADGRAIYVYPKLRRGKKSRAEKLGVRKQRNTRYRKLLVTGTGRCGTMWLTRMLRQMGLKIGHEKVYEDGTVSWYFCTDSRWYPSHPWDPSGEKVHVGERRTDFLFDRVVHVVRHPLPCIASIMTHMQALDFEFLEDNDIIPVVDRPKLLRAMYMWLNVNKEIENLTNGATPHQVEPLFRRLRHSWHPFAEDCGCISSELVDRLPVVKPANRGTGYREPRPLSWTDLREVDPTTTDVIRNMAHRYGYKR